MDGSWVAAASAAASAMAAAAAAAATATATAATAAALAPRGRAYKDMRAPGDTRKPYEFIGF